MKNPKQVFDMHVHMFQDVMSGKKCLSDIIPAHAGDCAESDGDIDFSNPDEVYAAIEGFSLFSFLGAVSDLVEANITGQQRRRQPEGLTRRPIEMQEIEIKQLD
jgi:hypothetical protein